MPKIYDYINSKILPEGLPGQFLVTDETGQKVWLTLNANFSVLEKIGYDEVTSKPLWEGSAWPGSVVGETGDLQDLFSQIAISGQQTLTATSPTDTLNIVAGDGIEITTDAPSKTISIKQQNYGSLTVPFVAGTTIYQGSMVAIGTNGRLVLASSNNMNLMGRVVGFYNNELTVGDGDRADVVTIGIVDDPMAYWDPASPIYVGVNGQLTQTPPVSGFSQVIGYPLTTTAFYIQIQPAVQL